MAVRLALSHAKQQGYAKAVAWIRKNNVASLALHRKLGFMVISEGVSKKGYEVFKLEKQI